MEYLTGSGCLYITKGITMIRLIRLRLTPFLMLALFLFQSGLQAEILGKLPNILDPTNITISEKEIYIVQDATIHVFSLPRLRPLRKMGGEGEGPGELKVTPWLSNTIAIFPEHIIFGSIDKYIVFSKSGKILEEKRRNPLFTQVIPFQGIQAVRKRVMDDNIQYSTINVYNPSTGSLKELYRQKFPGGRGKVEAVPDSIHFTVFGDHIYIEQSVNGFVIATYDKNGNRVSTLSPGIKALRIKDADRSQAIEKMKQDPFINTNPGGWENFQKTTDINFPANFPPIRDFVVTGEGIVVQTYRTKGDKEEYIFLNREGEIKKRLFLPASEKPSFTEEMMGTGVRYFAFSPTHYYRLLFTGDSCELERIFLSKIEDEAK